MKIPKYIIEKQRRLDKKLDEAYLLRSEIQDWAKKKGANVYSTEWFCTTMNEMDSITPTNLEGIKEYFEKYIEKGD